MKKQYVFLLLIVIILYIGYLIVSFKYKEYKINSNIEYITNLNLEIVEKISTAYDLIDYKTSKAYKNRILKEQQGYKNFGERVVYLTTEDKYNKYTQEENLLKEAIIEAKANEKASNLTEMTNTEKWIYFIFKKDLTL